MTRNVEAVFGGVLVLLVITAAVVAVLSFPGKGGPRRVAKSEKSALAMVEEIKTADDVICKCYDAAFAIAGSDVDVMSSQYRAGFEQCRALGEAAAGAAWTDGWNARLSAKPYEASCRSYKRARGV